MSEFSEYRDSMQDEGQINGRPCYCRGCKSEGRLDPGPDCLYPNS